MHCYFNLVSAHQTVIDHEGLEVADHAEARRLAREAVAEMIQDGVAELAHWRGWALEARDASRAVLFTVGFDAALTTPAREVGTHAVAEADGTSAYNKAA
jgi:hypothetical protein